MIATYNQFVEPALRYPARCFHGAITRDAQETVGNAAHPHEFEKLVDSNWRPTPRAAHCDRLTDIIERGALPSWFVGST